MIIYLTYNDYPSGIFSSQVIDVVKFIHSDLRHSVKLISFISIRNFYKNRSKIKDEFPQAIVLPMFPGVHRWRLSIPLLFIYIYFIKPKKIIARSVIATQLALRTRSSSTHEIIYDGRGAISSEWFEYKVVKHPRLLKEIFELEKDAVLKSDFRISISNKLVHHWKKNFGYCLQDHVIIPCTINKLFENVLIDKKMVSEARANLELGEEDVVFVYSGSIAGWQSFDLLKYFMSPVLVKSCQNKLLFLSETDEKIVELQKKFPSQVFCRKVRVNDVPQYLLAADYGLLLREDSVTNEVASPVKFAEYLACGLKVIISDNLGDYSEFVRAYKGVIDGTIHVDYDRVSIEDKIKINSLAKEFFSKSGFKDQYQRLISNRVNI